MRPLERAPRRRHGRLENADAHGRRTPPHRHAERHANGRARRRQRVGLAAERSATTPGVRETVTRTSGAGPPNVQLPLYGGVRTGLHPGCRRPAPNRPNPRWAPHRRLAAAPAAMAGRASDTMGAATSTTTRVRRAASGERTGTVVSASARTAARCGLPGRRTAPSTVARPRFGRDIDCGCNDRVSLARSHIGRHQATAAAATGRFGEQWPLGRCCFAPARLPTRRRSAR